MQNGARPCRESTGDDQDGDTNRHLQPMQQLAPDHQQGGRLLLSACAFPSCMAQQADGAACLAHVSVPKDGHTPVCVRSKITPALVLT